MSGELDTRKRIKVEEGAEANIILMDGSKMLVEKGINVHWTSKLNIYAQQGETGELTCSTTEHYIAAIGSNNNSGPNGAITIHGGKVTANNTLQGYGGNAAGIGAGNTGAGGTITIYGGTLADRIAGSPAGSSPPRAKTGRFRPAAGMVL